MSALDANHRAIEYFRGRGDSLVDGGLGVQVWGNRVWIPESMLKTQCDGLEFPSWKDGRQEDRGTCWSVSLA